MKKLLFLFVAGIGFAAFSHAQTEVKKTVISQTGAPVLKFEADKTTHDFGNIKEGTQATYEFKFTNTGKADLLLESVTASCGCTTPKWTKEPIPPGKSGNITAIYNSSGRPGNFVKTITVKHNGETGTDYLTIKGNVEPKVEEPQSPVVVPHN